MNPIICWNDMNFAQCKLTKRLLRKIRPEVQGFNLMDELDGYSCDVFIKPSNSTIHVNFFDRVNNKYFRNKDYKKLKIIVNNRDFRQCVEYLITCKHTIICDKYIAK